MVVPPAFGAPVSPYGRPAVVDEKQPESHA